MNANAIDFRRDVLESDLPVLVDFTASWCGPCKMIAPLVEKAAQEFSGKAKVVKIDIDQDPEPSNQLGIMGVPTLILFKNGQPVDRVVGAVPYQAIAAMIQRNL